MNDIPLIKVRDIMSTSVHLIDAVATVRQAMATMHEKGVSSLVITRRNENDEYAVVTITDVADKVIAENRSLDRTDVWEIMRKPALAVASEMDIRYAVRLLNRFGLSRALVVDHDRNLAGIVTVRDMVLAYVHYQEGGVEA